MTEALVSPEDLSGLESAEIVHLTFEKTQKAVFDEMAEVFVDPGPRGFEPNSSKSLRKHQPELRAAHKAYHESDAVEESVEHQRYLAAVKKRDDLQGKEKKIEAKFLHKELERCKESGDYQRFHRVLRNRRKAKSHADKISCLVDDSGCLQTRGDAIAAAMTEYVSRLYQGQGPLTLHDLAFDDTDLPPTHPLCDKNVTESDTAAAIARLKPRKAVGLDGLHAEMFIDATETEISSFTHAFDSIMGRQFPSQWKVDRKKSLYKKGSHSERRNYRQIGIQSTPRKIFDSILHARMTQIISLDPWQRAYQLGKRGTDNIFALNEVLKFQNRHKNREPFYVFQFDFEKAFDRVHIPTLIQKLQKRGIGGRLLKTLKSMYIGQKSRVDINGVLGEEFGINCGVSQGLVTSPFNFLVYVDDLFSQIRNAGLSIEMLSP